MYPVNQADANALTAPDLLAAVEDQAPRGPSARDRLAAFVQIPDNTEYEFDVPGTAKDADNFINHMRVELSRARDKMRARGRKIRKFKMIVVSKVYTRAEKRTVIVLRKHVNKQDELELLAANTLAQLEF